LIRRVVVVGIMTLCVVTCAYATERRHDAEVQEAFAFLSAIIVKLDNYRTENGVYPASISADWYAGTLPKLLQPDFYVVYDEGKRYLLRFRDPRFDPRFWWAYVYGYQSDIRRWEQYDGY
jgi:hypothetical protein